MHDRPRSAADARVAEREADAACKAASEVRTTARDRMDIQARAIADQLTDTKYRSIDNAIAEALALCDEYVERRTEWQAADAAYHAAFARWFELYKECTRLEQEDDA